MRLIKMFGLAAMAALMAMAFAGASSAMASSTAICDQDAAGGACAAGHLVSHVHEVTLSGAKAKLLTPTLTVECDVLFLGDVTSAGNLSELIELKDKTKHWVPLTIEGNLTYTNCGGCTVTEESASVIIEVLKTGHETASVAGKGEVKVVCLGVINCIYNGEGLEGTGQGPLLSSETNGSVVITGQQTTRVSGLLCPATSLLDITTTPLSASYIAS